MTIDFKDAWCVPSEYTYRDMTKPERREWMSHCQVASLGTKAGGFGKFTEEFKVVSFIGKGNIANEIEWLAKHLNVDHEYIMNECPTIKELLA